MWIDRTISNEVKYLSEKRPALLLTGARQTGKTSLLKRLFPDHSYTSLDLPLQADAAKHDGQRFLGQLVLPAILDEVQYAPEILRDLKVAIDADRDRTGQFLLTGSQRFPLMKGISESLAGRIGIVECLPLTALELERHYQKEANAAKIQEWMLRGGYPEVYQADLEPSQFYSDYVATYLERDVRLLMNVRDLADFERLLRLLAQRVGQLLSYTSLASDVGVSPNTVKAWIAILEASQVIALVQPFHRNLGKRLTKTPKVYFHDTGLACFLRGIQPQSTRLQIPEQQVGGLFENFVFCQLYSALSLKRMTRQLMFYRDRDGTEVDFIVDEGSGFRLFEVKWSENPKRDVKGFRTFSQLVGDENILEKRIVTHSRRKLSLGEIMIGDPISF